MAIAMTKFNRHPIIVAQGKHGNLHTATIYMQFSNTVPTNVTANATREADLPADLGTGGGYTQTTGVKVGCGLTAGATLSTATYVYKLTDSVFTASGGNVGPFRYMPLYNGTDAQKHLLGYYDYGSSITINDGHSFTMDFDGTNGVFTLV